MDATERINKRILAITGELVLIRQGKRRARGRRVRRLIDEVISLSCRVDSDAASKLHSDLNKIMGGA